MSWKTKGMNRDMSVSAFNPELSFENMNLRLLTNEGNTLMSWVNEKGTANIDIKNDFEYWSKEGEEDIYEDPHDESWTYHARNTVLPNLSGTPIGTAVLNHYLILFTVDTNWQYIYRLEYDSSKTFLKAKILCKCVPDYMGLSTEHPLETLVSYESDLVQKVYWVDGIHQLRVININKEYGLKNQADFCVFDAVREMELGETIRVEKQLSAPGMFAPGVIQYAFTYYDKYGQESNIFYVSPLQYISYKERGASPEDKVENAFKITVKNVDKEHFEYLRIYSIQRTSINATPICKRIQDIYIKDTQDASIPVATGYAYSNTEPHVIVDGGNVPYPISGATRNILGNNVTCIGYPKPSVGVLKVETDNGTFVFGESSTSNSVIWRTANKETINGVNAYYIVESPSLEDGAIEPLSSLVDLVYVDTGTSGDSIDPTELLYKGGDIVSIETIEQKDNTLFMGNIKLQRPSIASIKNNITVNIAENDTRKFSAVSVSSGYYTYGNQLTSKAIGRNLGMTVPCGGFKTGEVYRLGVQFQHKSGKWSDPLYIGDKIAQGKFDCDNSTNTITVPIFRGKLDAGASNLLSSGYKRMRPVVVFPSMIDRNIICQGVVAPTVYTPDSRNVNKDCFAQSSWFFRPYQTNDNPSSSAMVMPPKSISNNDNKALRYTSRQTDDDLPDVGGIIFNPQYIRQVEIEGQFNANAIENNVYKGSQFEIDRNYRTFHSPDVEFDDQVSLIDFTDKYYKQRGVAEFEFTMSDIEIQTETPTISNRGSGFVHKAFSSTGASGIVAGLFYDDFLVNDGIDRIEAYNDQKQSCKWLVYPWQSSGYLNNDMNRPADKGVASAKLKKKIISNLRYATSSLSDYGEFIGTEFTSFAPQVFNSDDVAILRFNEDENNRLYKGNIDTMLTPNEPDGKYFCLDGWDDGFTDVETPFNSTVWWKTFSKNPNDSDQEGIRRWTGEYWKWEDSIIGDEYVDMVLMKSQVRMKYKSTPHLFAKFSGIKEDKDNQLAIVEIKQSVSDATRFGGTSEDALRENIWIPCGEPVKIEANATLYWDYGDTYYQRYDCLKTYAFTPEDINQIVEIGSFMLETRVNIDGRYDRNRGQSNNLYMSPRNFNLINPVYSQQDNFFTYRIMPDDYYRDTKFPNQITWSKTKENGADVDLWTNVTLASVLELDGDKGEINKLIRFNNYLFAFQDSGISQILYNDNVQISATDGVPIEIANSGKVSGKDYKSNTIGCSNKWSMVQTPNGIYFMDSNDKSIYLFNGQLQNMSSALGFNSWAKNEIPAMDVKWNPVNFGAETADDKSTFMACFDKKNQDVLFINNDKALAYSEKLNGFTSFYDYGRTPFFCNLDDVGIWIRTDGTLWKHQEGDYCRFFGHNKPYWMTLVGNPEPQLDKIFTNLEFRASVDGDGKMETKTLVDPETLEEIVVETGKFIPARPFDSLETWNEYQHGYTTLDNKSGHSLFKHGGDSSALIRKFRIWRSDIPRNNCLLGEPEKGQTWPYSTDAELGVSRHIRKPQDRMRNPWLYLKLMKKAAVDVVIGSETTLNSLPKAEVHDIVMTYYG